MSQSSKSQIYLGIDVHKKSYSVTAFYDGSIVKTARMPASPKVLITFIRNFFPNQIINSVYEAGFSGLTLHRYLLRSGINNIVVHPASIEVASNERAKTDKRDSKKMAIQLAAGRLKCIHIHSEQREHWRAISRLRESFVKERTRVGAKLKSLMFYFGLIPHDHVKRISRKWICALMKL